MKWSRVARGGVLAGVAAALIIAAAGWLLGVGITPWSWSSTVTGALGRSIELARVAILLTPIGVMLGTVVAFACALVFEFVTLRAGSIRGSIVGLLLGIAGAMLLGLIPWFADWIGYMYVPAEAPLGPHDPAWLLAAFAVAGTIAGAIAGALYGTPRHQLQTPDAFRWREVYPTRRVR